MRSLSFVCAAFVLCGLVAMVHSEPATRKASVSVDDLGERVNVVGRLGKHLHEFMTVEGKWVSPNDGGVPKDAAPVFRVTRIDDVAHESVDFEYWCVEGFDSNENPIKFRVGETWKMRAYETAKFSAPTFHELKAGQRGLVQAARGTRFATARLVGIITSQLIEAQK